MYKVVAGAKDQTAFLAITLLTVLGMSGFTQALGLSDTLGAFLAGVLLAETKYRYQIEADIAPFRGLLLGLFFITTGFSIDVGLAVGNLPLVLGFGTCCRKSAKGGAPLISSRQRIPQGGWALDRRRTTDWLGSSLSSEPRG